MINLPNSNCKTISQSHYDSIVNNTEIKSLECTACGMTGTLAIHGYYKRSVRAENGIVVLRILRLKCSCGKTHAVLLSSMVPYSQILLKDQISIISDAKASVASFQLSVPDISRSLIIHIKKIYQLFWKALIYPLTVSSLQEDITSYCYEKYGCQFMQMHSNPFIAFTT